MFNEIMYNPADVVDGDGEWIELHNQLNVDMDISDWRLAGGVEYQFPDQTVVPARGYRLVAGNPVHLAAAASATDVLGP